MWGSLSGLVVREESALPKSGEAAFLTSVGSVDRIRLEREGQGPLGSLLWSERAAGPAWSKS